MTQSEAQAAEISGAARPMWSGEEVVQYSPAAAIRWQNEAATRAVTLLEHDSIIVGILALRDFVARPQVTGAPSSRGTIARSPYLTVPYYDPSSKEWRRIPAVGIYERPSDETAGKWYDALTALVWRIADQTTTEPAPTAAAEVTSDAVPVAVYGENAQATITTPGLRFRENAETVRAAPTVVAGAMAYAEQIGRAASGNVTALEASQIAAIAAAESLRNQLVTEREAVAKRGTMRALGTGALALAGAYFYSRS